VVDWRWTGADGSMMACHCRYGVVPPRPRLFYGGSLLTRIFMDVIVPGPYREPSKFSEFIEIGEILLQKSP
jgi:hypothetical protein